MVFFDSLEMLPVDPILGLTAAFAADKHPNKVNLGVGSYKDAQGKSWILPSVKHAESLILQQQINKDYLPIDGNPSYVEKSLQLIFGTSPPYTEGLTYGAQSLGGTGALRIGAEFLSRHNYKTILVSNPTWPNHAGTFTKAGMTLGTYPYYDSIKQEIDFAKTCESLQKAAPGTVVLLHACCHNPTGMDFSSQQWKELSTIIKSKKLIPFFDFAYLGFSESVKADAEPIRYFAEQGHELLVALSYSKNFGLYSERAGLLAIVAHTKDAKEKIGTHIRSLIRGTWSNPPSHGAAIVSTILQSDSLHKQWLEELSNMRTRIKKMRYSLAEGLMAKGSHKNFEFIKRENGLFSFCGLDKTQVQLLINEKGIHMPLDGRINVAGLNENNIEYVIDAILSVL